MRKKIFILQNSNLIFGLDAATIYQPEKYALYLIVNEFSAAIAREKKQLNYYTQVFITNDFSESAILNLIKAELKNSTEAFNVVTNSEETMPICGAVRKALGLDNEDYARFFDKVIMKQTLSANKNILTPKYKLFCANSYNKYGKNYLAQLSENMQFPLFAKPTQCYSSINLTKINNTSELIAWANSLNSNEIYEIDEFIDGTMYHCDSFIKNSQILFTIVSMNSRPCYDFTIGEMKGTIALPENHPDSIELTQFNKLALETLGLPQGGVTHLELIKTRDGRIYFIEIAHRSPGCLIPKMYESFANIHTITAHFLLQIDDDYVPQPTKTAFAAWACYPKSLGTVTALNALPTNLSSQCEVDWKVAVGDKISGYSQSGRDYTGTVFMTNSNFTTLFNEFMLINNLNLCVIQ